MSEVYIYFLKRSSPLFEEGEKDVWSLIGIFGPEQALRQFENEVGCRLERIDDPELVGEFEFTQRTSIAARSGLQPGDMINKFWVDRLQR